MMLGLYRAATTLAGPAVRAYLMRRRARGKEDPERFTERLGQAGRARPDGPVVWIHAASVGESVSVLPVIERLCGGNRDLSVLLTTGTVTSARLMADRLPEQAFHQFVPVDRPTYVRRFLDHWRPDLAIWMESEFWPNLIVDCGSRGTPMLLLNGRVSDRSWARWRRHPHLIGELLSRFALCLGQSPLDAERLAGLGAPQAKYVGNLKYAAAPLPADDQDLAALTGVLGARPRWVAASTHAGEEEICARVHRRLRERHPDLLTILAPRHPERGAAIAKILAAERHLVARRSLGEALAPETDIYLADTLGELGLLYRLGHVAFIGKSLVPGGGQNPLEAARLSRPVIFGPHMDNFTEIASRLIEEGGAQRVADENELTHALDLLLSDAGDRARRAEAGRRVAEAEAGVLEAVMDELAPFLIRIARAEGHFACA